MAEAGAWDGGLLADADLMTPMCVRFAATVGLADHIADGARTVAELAAVIAADGVLCEALPPDAVLAVDRHLLDAVLRRLAFAGVVTADESGCYALTAKGEYLRDGHPHQVRPWLHLLWPISRGDVSLVHLLPAVLTGKPTFDLEHGRSFWEDLAADDGRATRFARLMGLARQAAEAPEVVDKYGWAALGSVVDVGGGDGSVLINVLNAHSGLRGAVFELAGPAASAAQAALRREGLDDRAEVITGNFFTELPTGFGGYVLSGILQDWADEPAVQILTNCAAAAGANGRVLVIEGWGHGHGADMETAMALRLAALFGGQERSVAQLSALAKAAGLTVTTVIPTRYRTIIELATTRGS